MPYCCGGVRIDRNEGTIIVGNIWEFRSNSNSITGAAAAAGNELLLRKKR